MQIVLKPIKTPPHKLNPTRWAELIKFLEEKKSEAYDDIVYIDKLFHLGEISLSEYGRIKYFIRRRVDGIQGIFDILKK